LWRIEALFLIIGREGSVNAMSEIRCHRCAKPLVEGSLKYQVEIRIRSHFDGVIPELTEERPANDLDAILAETAGCSEEELTRQVYQDDVFIMCPSCKEAFLHDVYSRIHPEAGPREGHLHLIN
jgi:phage FluMu protein Com